MVRLMSFLLSFWLALLFICATAAHYPKLLVFFVGIGALFACFGGFVAPMVSVWWRIVGPVALTLGLVAVGVAAMVLNTPPWLPFCVFIGTFWFIAIVIAELWWSPRNRGTMAPADS